MQTKNEVKSKVKYTYDLLKTCIEKYQATLVGVYDFNKLTRETRIFFKCKCGLEFDKKFRSIYETSMLCSTCQNKFAQAKLTATNITKYGVEYVFQSSDVKAKITNTNLKKYGAKCSLQNKFVQAKSKATNITKYGVENVFQSSEIKAKIKETNVNKYGVAHPAQNLQIQAKMKNTMVQNYGVPYASQNAEIQEKTKNTMVQRYGVPYAYQNLDIQTKYKQTMKRKYGAEHPSHCAEISQKSLKSAFKLKKVKTPSGKIIFMQGYEPVAYQLLLKTYTEDEILHERTQVPEIWWVDDNNYKHRYYMDFFISKDKLVVEVKSIWTYKLDKSKITKTKQACEEAGFRFECWMFDNKKHKVNVDIQ
jgi:hypothetical protein